MNKIKTTTKKRTEGFRILVVDDDDLILKYFPTILPLSKYIVKIAKDGVEGLSKAKEFNPDIIISDVVMPNMDGYELCKAVRSHPKFKNTIFLLSSANLTEAKDAIKGLKGGADDYLLKPLKKDATIAKIDAFLRLKLLEDDLLDSNKKLTETIEVLEKNKKQLEESIAAEEKEKELLKNSLKEISFLLEELEKSHHYQITLNRSLKKNFDDLVSLLATIIELRNPIHKGHSQKVAEISKFIANEFGLLENEIREIEVAALLHEIGMIGIPDDIFVKNPTERDDYEKRIVSQYPLVGESLIKGYPGLEKAAKIIRHLHENIDGTGYPDGLVGEETPIGSQIIKVASRFDRMSSELINPSDIYGILIFLRDLKDIEFNSQVLHYLYKYVDTFADRRTSNRNEKIDIFDLKEGMILSEDVYTSTGIKLVPKGSKLTESAINCILNYNKTDPLEKDILIKVI